MSSSKNNAVDLAQKTFLVISGASRGIGQTMAIECASKFLNGSVIILLARSSNGLEVTKSQILAKNQANITVFTFAIDLCKPSTEALDNIFSTALNGRNITDFQSAILIHNVGTIGDITKWAREFGENDLNKWQDYYSINVFSVVALNNAFMRLFETHNSSVQPDQRIPRLIVNITSKSATVPFKSFTLYCSGKAAREMYFHVLAEEELETDPRLTVLNYSPGPVETDMSVDAQANSVSSDTRDMFKNSREQKTILKTIDTTSKFIQVIEKGAFKSGDHVDYYDQ